MSGSKMGELTIRSWEIKGQLIDVALLSPHSKWDNQTVNSFQRTETTKFRIHLTRSQTNHEFNLINTCYDKDSVFKAQLHIF